MRCLRARVWPVAQLSRRPFQCGARYCKCRDGAAGECRAFILSRRSRDSCGLGGSGGSLEFERLACAVLRNSFLELFRVVGALHKQTSSSAAKVSRKRSYSVALLSYRRNRFCVLFDRRVDISSTRSLPLDCEVVSGGNRKVYRGFAAAAVGLVR